jgi:hypothetical protein
LQGKAAVKWLFKSNLTAAKNKCSRVWRDCFFKKYVFWKKQPKKTLFLGEKIYKKKFGKHAKSTDM